MPRSKRVTGRPRTEQVQSKGERGRSVEASKSASPRRRGGSSPDAPRPPGGKRKDGNADGADPAGPRTWGAGSA